MRNPKSKLTIFCLWIFFSTRLWSQPGAALEGVWLREDKRNYKVKIENRNGVYNGKIIWMKDSLDANGNHRLDTENPDPTLRSRPLMGLTLLREFKYDGKNRWRDGRIYHFTRGTEYNARIEMVERDRIKLAISVWFITRIYYWQRVSK